MIYTVLSSGFRSVNKATSERFYFISHIWIIPRTTVYVVNIFLKG